MGCSKIEIVISQSQPGVYFLWRHHRKFSCPLWPPALLLGTHLTDGWICQEELRILSLHKAGVLFASATQQPSLRGRAAFTQLCQQWGGKPGGFWGWTSESLILQQHFPRALALVKLTLALLPASLAIFQLVLNWSAEQGHHKPQNYETKDCKMAQPLWKSLAVLQTVKHRITLWLSNSATRYIYSREMKTYAYTKICTQVFIVALFITTRKTMQKLMDG